jgi:hypothetical protein
MKHLCDTRHHQPTFASCFGVIDSGFLDIQHSLESWICITHPYLRFLYYSLLSIVRLLAIFMINLVNATLAAGNPSLVEALGSTNGSHVYLTPMPTPTHTDDLFASNDTLRFVIITYAALI